MISIQKVHTDEIFVKEMAAIDWFLIQRVKEMRKRLGMSQLQLSIKMGYTESFIGKIESPKERAKYRLRHLYGLAKAFKCQPQDLFPDKILKHDMVRLTFLVKKSWKRKGKRIYDLIKEEGFE